MSKVLQSVIKCQIPAGGAKPAPPLGPALGQVRESVVVVCVVRMLFWFGRHLDRMLTVKAR
jgi:hypothetical protein